MNNWDRFLFWLLMGMLTVVPISRAVEGYILGDGSWEFAGHEFATKVLSAATYGFCMLGIVWVCWENPRNGRLGTGFAAIGTFLLIYLSIAGIFAMVPPSFSPPVSALPGR